MSYLELAKRIRAGLEQGDPAPLVDDPIVQAREQIGAVLVASPRYGECWIALTEGVAAEIRAEEAQRSNPRPVLQPADVGALAGKSETAVRSTLEVFQVFGEARIQ